MRPLEECSVAPHLADDTLDANRALYFAPPERQGAVRVLGELLCFAALEVRVPHKPSLIEALNGNK